MPLRGLTVALCLLLAPMPVAAEHGRMFDWAPYEDPCPALYTCGFVFLVWTKAEYQAACPQDTPLDYTPECEDEDGCEKFFIPSICYGFLPEPMEVTVSPPGYEVTEFKINGATFPDLVLNEDYVAVNVAFRSPPGVAAMQGGRSGYSNRMVFKFKMRIQSVTGMRVR